MAFGVGGDADAEPADMFGQRRQLHGVRKLTSGQTLMAGQRWIAPEGEHVLQTRLVIGAEYLGELGAGVGSAHEVGHRHAPTSLCKLHHEIMGTLTGRASGPIGDGDEGRAERFQLDQCRLQPLLCGGVTRWPELDGDTTRRTEQLNDPRHETSVCQLGGAMRPSVRRSAGTCTRLPRMEDLTGRVAVVTGAASGIGFGMASAFAGEGMKVVLADIEDEALETACKQLRDDGANAIAVPTDVSDAEALDALRDATLSAFGAAHVVCNNAGVAVGGPIWQVPLEAWKWVFGVNFWGVVHGLRSFVPLLLEQGEGHVVNTASAAGLTATPFLGPYAATKHAVVAISESLALELAGSPVGVSVLCPLWVRTASASQTVAIVDAYNDPNALAGARDVVAAFVNSGFAPEVVAGRVVEAVKGKGFWVFPHDELREAVRARGQSIADGELPRFSLLT